MGIYSNLKKLDKLISDIKQILTNTGKTISLISDRYTVPHKYDTNTRTESVLIGSLHEGLKQYDLFNAWRKLLQGLDEESQTRLNLALARIERIMKDKDKKLTIFTREELEEREHHYLTFARAIVQLSEDCYALRDYFLPINHFEPSIFYQSYSIEQLLYDFSNKDIIDAGAYIGDSAIFFSRLTNGKVYAFEPVRANYELMLKTIKLNQSENIVPENFALSDGASCTLAMTSSGASSRIGSSFVGETVDAIRLDDYVSQYGLNVGLIKADLEGSEQAFLAGAYDTIRTNTPALIISIYHNADDFLHIKPIIESWGLGYKFKISKPAVGHIVAETVLLAWVPAQ